MIHPKTILWLIRIAVTLKRSETAHTTPAKINFKPNIGQKPIIAKRFRAYSFSSAVGPHFCLATHVLWISRICKRTASAEKTIIMVVEARLFLSRAKKDTARIKKEVEQNKAIGTEGPHKPHFQYIYNSIKI